jgi:hypothetical protein
MTVSERCGPSARLAPNRLFAPFRLSEPITRRFSALLYLGGRLPRSEIVMWWMLSTTSRYST